MLEKSIEDDSLEEVLSFLSSLELFQKLERATLKDLVTSMRLVQLEGGEKLIQQGEVDRTLYILWHGRLRVDRNGSMAAELSVGEVVGEVALLTGEPRTATVRAIRDSVLFKLDYEKFEQFEQIHPQGVAWIARKAVKRLVSKHHPVQPGENTVIITVAPAGGSNHLPFLHRLYEELNKIEPTILVTKEMCACQFNRDVGEIGSEDRDHTAINEWLISLEKSYRFILCETDREKTPWTERCLRQADMIFFVAEAGKSSEHHPIEELVYQQDVAPNTVMVFVHPDGNTAIKGTHLWLRTRPVHGYHHLQLGSDHDFARLIRFMTGRAFGVVLNGGGMRGFAHVGVLKALEELKITIDCIGGCSIGSAIAGAYARVGLEGAVEICHHTELPRTSTDYTFPAVALLKGKNVSDFYQKIYGDQYIEDLKMRYFCVSSDLTHSKLHVHDQGVLWKAIRASTAIPAVYPPMYDEESGGMLVDGALMNNMPVDVMRKLLGGGKILAVDCNIEPLAKSKVIKQSWQSGWKLFFRKRGEYDNIFKIIRTAFMFSSEKNQESMKNDADFLVEVETKKYAVLKVQDMDAIIEQGYRSAMEQLPAQLKL